MTSGSKVAKQAMCPERRQRAHGPVDLLAHQVLLDLMGDATSVNGTCIYSIAPFRFDRPLIRSSFNSGHKIKRPVQWRLCQHLTHAMQQMTPERGALRSTGVNLPSFGAQARGAFPLQLPAHPVVGGNLIGPRADADRLAGASVRSP